MNFYSALAIYRQRKFNQGITRLALHAFTLAPQGCLQTSFYADRPEDFDLALEAWKSVSYTTEN